MNLRSAGQTKSAGLRLGVSGIAQALEIGNNEGFVLSYTQTHTHRNP